MHLISKSPIHPPLGDLQWSPSIFGGVHAQGRVVSPIVKATTGVVRDGDFDCAWKTGDLESRWRFVGFDSIKFELKSKLDSSFMFLLLGVSFYISSRLSRNPSSFRIMSPCLSKSRSLWYWLLV